MKAVVAFCLHSCHFRRWELYGHLDWVAGERRSCNEIKIGITLTRKTNSLLCFLELMPHASNGTLNLCLIKASGRGQCNTTYLTHWFGQLLELCKSHDKQAGDNLLTESDTQSSQTSHAQAGHCQH